MLTSKAPRLSGSHKTRMEVETPVEYEAAKRILELLNFSRQRNLFQLREEYRLDGCPVCLDHIPPPDGSWRIEGPPGKSATSPRRRGSGLPTGSIGLIASSLNAPRK
jgi:hypothetical protein